MSIRRPFICLALFAMTSASMEPRSAHAGPLLDWLFGHHRASGPAYPVGPPVPVGTAAGGTVANMPITGIPMTGAPGAAISVPGYSAGYGTGYSAAMPATSVPLNSVPLSGSAVGNYGVGGYPPAGFPASGYAANYGNYYGSRMPVIGPSGYGYAASQPNGIAAATAPTIMSYVPDYRTTQYRAPVTYYRPLMTTDPNTGAQVVALAPCSSYEYQTQRVPTFGYNGVLGSYSTPPVVPAPPSIPTYTLPSGGVPIAAGGATSVLPPATNSYAMGYAPSYSSPTYTAPTSSTPSYGSPTYSSPSYSSNYGAYSPQQPGLTAPPASTYPTQPMSTPQGYYGSATGGSAGGSTGTYRTPTYTPVPSYTPGLSAPQGPAQGPAQVPSLQAPPIQSPYPTNSYPAPGYQPSYQPTTPSFPVNPPTRLSDPSGDVAPVLPPNLGASNDRSQLRAIVRQPMAANNSLNNSFSNTEAQTNSNPLNSARTNQQAQQSLQPEPRRDSQSPLMDPIPAPPNLEQQPRWNPGLLKEEDRTALRPVAPNYPQPSYAYAGQGKPIQWASFHGNEPQSGSVARVANVEPTQRAENQLSFSSSAEQAPSTSSGLRPIAAPTAPQQQLEQQLEQQPAPRQPAPSQRAVQPTTRQTGGWNVAK